MKKRVKQIKIKNQANYQYNNLNSHKNFESKLLKIFKKHAAIKEIDDCKNIWSLTTPVYLFINHASGYIKEKGKNKYLIFDNFADENKELLKNL